MKNKLLRQSIDRLKSLEIGIDILVNNASAISLTGTLETSSKTYDLMHSINGRGTYLTSKICLPFLLKSNNPHILNIAPPLNMKPVWFKNHVAYTMSKYLMSMCVLGMSEELRSKGVAVNALWPATAIATAALSIALKNMGGSGGDMLNKTRKPEIMGDSAYHIITSDSKKNTGNFYIDEEILKKNGITNFDQYLYDKNFKGTLVRDFFID